MPCPRNAFTSLVLISFCATIIGCTTASKHGESNKPSLAIAQAKNLVYTPSYWPEPLAGDIVRPNNQQMYPAVIMLHGGGWTRRSRRDMASLSKAVAKQGFVVFNVAYRFAPEYPFPAQIHDIQLATRWLRENASVYGVDTNKVAAWGYSSGAHLAAMLGVINAGDALDSPHGGNNARLQAVVAGGIPADLRKYEDSKLVNDFLGATLADNPQRYADSSPVTHATANDPPFYFYHGKLDFVTPIDHAEEFKAVLDEQEVETEMYVHGFRAHLSMFFAGGDSVPNGIAFLKRQFGTAQRH